MTDDTRPWTPAQAQFQTWLSLPKRLRRPRTQRDLAERLGVTEATLDEWKRLPGFQDAVNAGIAALTVGEVADVVAALVRQARQGSKSHAELLLTIAGLVRKRVEHSGEGGGPVMVQVIRSDDAED